MKCSASGIVDVLSKPHKVPDYQRPFAWKKEHIESFFDDLEGFVNEKGEKKSKEYHFGQIIVHEELAINNKGNEYSVYNIVDGQQRLITSTIFLCVVRDIIKERKIDNEFLKHRVDSCIGFDANGFNLAVGTLNQTFFRAYILRGEHDKKPGHHSNKLIKDAYSILKNKVENYIGTEKPEKNLENLTTVFLDKFVVTRVETEDPNQAFTMFEKLNSRGVRLGTSDLLKNFLFSKLNDPKYNIKDEWSRLMNSIAENGCDESKFIRYHWNSANKYASKDKVFDEISKMENTEDIRAYFDDLTSSKDSYLNVMKPNTMPEGSKLRDHLATLKDLGAKSFCPLWMALNRSNVDDADKLRILERTEALFIRNLVCNASASGIDNMFASIAFKFSKGIYSIDEIVVQIDKRIKNYVDDETVKDKFSTLECTAKKGRMILIKMYNKELKEFNIGSRKVHLEHIMPQNRGEWNITEEDHKKFVNRLGNLMLLDKEINEKASNSLFEEKKKHYEGTKIEDNKRVIEKDVWGPSEIVTRQEELCDKFVLLWPECDKTTHHKSLE